MGYIVAQYVAHIYSRKDDSGDRYKEKNSVRAVKTQTVRQKTRH